MLGKMGSWWVNPKSLQNHWSAVKYRIWEVNPKARPPSVNWVLKHIHPNDSNLILDAIKVVGETRKIKEFQYRMRLTENEPWRYFFTRIRPWKIGDEVLEVKGVNFEVTDIIRYQQELEKQNASLNTKNEKLREYVRMNSHDVRGPLSNILSILEIESIEPLDREQFVQGVSDAATRLDNVLKKINDTILIED